MGAAVLLWNVGWTWLERVDRKRDAERERKREEERQRERDLEAEREREREERRRTSGAFGGKKDKKNRR